MNKGQISVFSDIPPQATHTFPSELDLQQHPQLYYYIFTKTDVRNKQVWVCEPFCCRSGSYRVKRSRQAFALDSFIQRQLYLIAQKPININYFYRFLFNPQVYFKNYSNNHSTEMSSLSVSSKHIEIEENKMGSIVMKNIKTGASDASNSILFKVKTNLKDKVDVRPSFGVLHPDSSIINLNIRYLGELENIQKTKLMISWIATPGKKELGDKFSHEEFTNQFAKASKVNEGSLILPFKLKEDAQKERFQANKSDNNLSNSNQKSSDPFPLIADEKKIQRQKQSQQEEQREQQQPLIGQKKQQIKQEQQKQPIKVHSGFSLKTLIIVFILSFSLGLFAGIKIDQIKQNWNDVTIQPVQLDQSKVQQTKQSSNELQAEIQQAQQERHRQSSQQQQQESNLDI